jgi:hypothetical protein
MNLSLSGPEMECYVLDMKCTPKGSCISGLVPNATMLSEMGFGEVILS